MNRKRTKIVATISDKNCEPLFLKELYEAGMDVIRINSAHCDIEGALRIINNAREISDKIAILIDTKGPEIRTTICDNPVQLKKGNRVNVIGNREKKTTEEVIYVTYPAFSGEIPLGSKILLDEYAPKLDAEGRRLLNVVRDNTKKMAQLIDDMQDFSRTGRMAITPAEINMDALVREVVDELKPSAAGRELKLEIKSLPPVWADRIMLRRVMVNLLSNAIKFTRPKAVALIEVGARTEGNETIYYVKDNGVGFDMQYADKLFGVFQRLHGPAEFEGTGIGLTIVKRIISLHGGRVWAEGKLNEGATIYFAIPESVVSG